eukprot:3964191-Pyramimonas_sp.AAC.1
MADDDATERETRSIGSGRHSGLGGEFGIRSALPETLNASPDPELRPEPRVSFGTAPPGDPLMTPW